MCALPTLTFVCHLRAWCLWRSEVFNLSEPELHMVVRLHVGAETRLLRKGLGLLAAQQLAVSGDDAEHGLSSVGTGC